MYFNLFNPDQNYGGGYENINTGILGPVQLVGQSGDETVIKDLSEHKWSYKVGLHGMKDKLFSSDSRYATKWSAESLPVNRMMTWYKVHNPKFYCINFFLCSVFKL